MRLIRSVKDHKTPQVPIDVENALEASSAPISVEDLTRRGFTAVKVLNRKRIGMLIRQAVSEVVEDHAAKHMVNERARLEQESQKRLDELMHGKQSGFATAKPQPDTLGVNQLAELITALLRDRGTQTVAMPGTPQMPAAPESQRLDAIEQRMDKLLNVLERGDFGSRSSAGPRHQYRAATEQIDEHQQAMLKDIFQQNIELQAF